MAEGESSLLVNIPLSLPLILGGGGRGGEGLRRLRLATC